jgi:hypothetical protein
MSKHFVKYTLLGLFSVIVACLWFSSHHTFAASGVPGLSIYPLRTEPSIAPGTVYTGQITLSNTTMGTMNIDMSAEEFGVTDEQYDYSFDPGSSIVDWVRFDPSIFSLDPNRSQTVTYSVSVPIGAEPRGQYISLFATSEKQTDSTGITSQERVASLLYITVEGNVTRFGRILSLRNGWLVTGPTQWAAEIQNTGTTHYRSIYTEVTKSLLNTTIASGGGSDLILPSTIRLVEGNIALPPFSGIYKIVYTIGLGDYPAHLETRYIVYIRPIDAGVFGTIVLIFLAVRYFPIKKKQQKIS